MDYEGRPDDVDERIGRPDHVQVSTRDLFAPDIDIDDARQRWMFRMVHTRRPLQEKMTLFWHNHFATAYSKLATDSGTVQGAKMLAHKPGVLRGPQGQIELFRQYALGNFRNLLVEVAQDPAMLIWLDGKTNTKAQPQENFGREVMELFSVGVGNYTEPDVYAAARVFTGWNLRGSDGLQQRRVRGHERLSGVRLQRGPARHRRQDVLVPDLHHGSRTIPARSESAGMQDGIDLITALAVHPETARRLARKFWNFFISEVHAPDPAFVTSTANVYLQNGTRDPAGRAYRPDLALVHRSRDAPRALFVAGGVRHAGHQGGRLAEPLARQGASADGQHGHAAVRAAQRRGMAARRGLVLDLDDAGAFELRGHARVQPEGVPGRGAGAGRPDAADDCSRPCSIA